MLTIIRKIIYHLVSVALRAWQRELIIRLDLEAEARKEVNHEVEKKTAEESK